MNMSKSEQIGELSELSLVSLNEKLRTAQRLIDGILETFGDEFLSQYLDTIRHNSSDIHNLGENVPHDSFLNLTDVNIQNNTLTDNEKKILIVSDDAQVVEALPDYSAINIFSLIAGTTNRITVTDDGDGTITLSTPQDTDTGADIIFATITLNNEGLHLLDTDASHDLIIKPGSDLTADRILTLITGDSARTITLTGNPTLADWFDQAVKTTSSPTFAGLTKVGDASNYLAVASDGELTLAGTARVKKEFTLPLTDFNPGASGPTAALHGIYPTYEFGIGDDMHTSFEIPPDWDETTDVEISVYWAIDEAYAANSAEVQWQAAWAACPADETEDLTSPNDTGTIDFGDQDIPANANYATKISGSITAASISHGDVIVLNGSRVALDGGNNPTAEPYIYNIEVEYIAHSLGEAT